MKVFLFDYSNDGVLHVCNSIPVINHLKRGLVDCDIRVLGPAFVGYNKITSDEVRNGRHAQLTRIGDIVDLSESGQNELYLERRRLVKIRAPLMEKLCYYGWLVSAKVRSSPWDGFEDHLEYALSTSDFENKIWSDSINEYAHINSIPPESAYKELKIEYENTHSLKMRIYASIVYFANKINNISTETESSEILNKMVDRFWRDAWI